MATARTTTTNVYHLTPYSYRTYRSTPGPDEALWRPYTTLIFKVLMGALQIPEAFRREMQTHHSKIFIHMQDNTRLKHTMYMMCLA